MLSELSKLAAVLLLVFIVVFVLCYGHDMASESADNIEKNTGSTQSSNEIEEKRLNNNKKEIEANDREVSNTTEKKESDNKIIECEIKSIYCTEKKWYVTLEYNNTTEDMVIPESILDNIQVGDKIKVQLYKTGNSSRQQIKLRFAGLINVEKIHNKKFVLLNDEGLN